MHSAIDLHEHLIYGVDDGARTLEDSLRMLQAAQEDGIGWIVGTSHAYPSLQPFPLERYTRHLAAVNQLSRERQLGVSVYEGCEIFYSPIALRQLEAGALPTLAGSRFTLIEFDPTLSTDGLIDALRQVANAGFVPVIAHVERYDALFRDIDALLDARQQFPLRIQMNCDTIAQKCPRPVRKFRDALLREDAVDYVASDAHDTKRRPTRMLDAYRALEKQYGVQRARRLTGDNQMELFA